MAATKKDYEAAAAIIAATLPDVPDFQAEVARRFADHFQDGSPRFNRVLFLEAAGVSPMVCPECGEGAAFDPLGPETCAECGGRVRPR